MPGILSQERKEYKPPSRPMTHAEFEELPRQLGWKYEFLEGQVVQTPSPYAVATLRLPLHKPWPMRYGPEAQIVKPEDRRGLERLFYLAFVDSVEYHDCPRGYIRQRATASLGAFLDEASQRWFRAARLIRAGSKVLAGVLIRTCTRGPIVEPLMVRPSHQRQGMATSLMTQVVNHLLEMGATELFSQCHLANEMSWNWHKKFGFEELPDEWVAIHRARWLRYEWQRRERAEELSAAESDEWRRQTLNWESEAERMKVMSERDFQGAHPQLM